ncbi:hypothetical protein SAMN04488056_10735 [Cohaesibacter marisflavi]|uniref:Uncharacterized protein n=1 Tax=Cohaesibacter marisflavi TaxID=655353 RepID=A0A1I5HPW8_9HYPH|nr:hypothetical protein SAMN04488056_10735 [Cohaesibacter marisflavi]
MATGSHEIPFFVAAPFDRLALHGVLGVLICRNRLLEEELK